MKTQFKTLSSEAVSVPPVSALTSGLADDNYLFITGQLAYDAQISGISQSLSAAQQTKIVMTRIKLLLDSEGLTFQDLVKVTIFVMNPVDIMDVNAEYTKWVSEPFPARSTIGIAFLALPEAKVEIEAIARKKTN